jgi:signal transduction histidine kinase
MAKITDIPSTRQDGGHKASVTRKFAIASGAIILLAAVFLVNIHRLAISQQTDRIAGETHGYVLQALTNGLLSRAIPLLDLAETDRELAPTYPSYRRLDAAVRRHLAGTPILKLRIYNTSGRVAYSTDPNDLSVDYSKKERFRAALAGGHVVRHLFRESFTAWSGPREKVWLLAGYMPIRSGEGEDPVIGVIEIYRDITSLHEALNSASIESGLVIAGAFALIFTLLLMIVWNADKTARAEHQANLELARAKAQAEAAAREKTQFIASISHELRTPLNAIIGFAEILQNEIKGPLGHSSYREYVGDIGKAGAHLLSIINDVLDLVKLESGNLTPDPQPTDVLSVAGSVARMLAPEAARFGNALEVERTSELRAIETDAGKLRQILVNIASNGLKFTPKGGRVRIKISQDAESGAAVVRVIDNGIGMRAEDIAIAEAPFGQVQNVLTRAHEGTGLGLTLSRRYTEALCGTFKIESTPDVGTAVTITLPEKFPGAEGNAGRAADGAPRAAARSDAA